MLRVETGPSMHSFLAVLIDLHDRDGWAYLAHRHLQSPPLLSRDRLQ